MCLWHLYDVLKFVIVKCRVLNVPTSNRFSSIERLLVLQFLCGINAQSLNYILYMLSYYKLNHHLATDWMPNHKNLRDTIGSVSLA